MAERELLERLIARFYASTGRDLSLRDVSEQYLADLRSRRAKPHTIEQAERSLRLLREGLRARTVGQVTVAKVHAWRARRTAAGASNRTANLDVGVLSSAFALAVRLKQIDENPLEGFEPLDTGEKFQTRTHRALSKEEIRRLREAAAGLDARAPDKFPREPLLAALIFTGARWSELTLTSWSDLDAAACELTLRAGNTKDGETRTIPLRPEVLRSLLALRVAHARVTGQPPAPDARIFLTPQGARWGADTGNFLRWLHEVMRIAQVPKKGPCGGTLNVHALRHTFVTMLVREGVPDQVIAKLTGHASLQMVKRYTHLNRDDMRRAIASLPGLFDAL